MLGISQDGTILRIHIQNEKAFTEKVSKTSTRFVDLIIGNQNYYGITENREGWAWGKNAHG